MRTTQIGVHLADHSFFPVFEDEHPGKRRVLLSTSHPDQDCVDIVLYRRADGDESTAERLGHILLCDVAPGNPEDSEIELTIDLREDGTLDAVARDTRSGNIRDVSIDPRDAIPAYTDASDPFGSPITEDPFEDDPAQYLLHRKGALPASQSSRKNGWLLLLLALFLMALVGVLTWAIFLREQPQPAGPAVVAPPAPPEPAAAAPAPQPAPPAPAVVAPPATQPAPTAGAPAAEAPATLPQAALPGQDYQIRWGDTLWDISRMFYGTPWRFPEIADENRIPNPDLIYAEDQITIPSR